MVPSTIAEEEEQTGRVTDETSRPKGSKGRLGTSRMPASAKVLGCAHDKKPHFRKQTVDPRAKKSGARGAQSGRANEAIEQMQAAQAEVKVEEASEAADQAATAVAEADGAADPLAKLAAQQATIEEQRQDLAALVQYVDETGDPDFAGTELGQQVLDSAYGVVELS